MISFPNCKINIGLWVTEKRTDGYHNIQSIIVPVPWCDILEIIPSGSPETTLIVTGREVDIPIEQNLCYRAWQLLAENYNIPAVNIHLHKVVPTGAGLGGGSSDASFTLRLLNELFSLHLDDAKLQEHAESLGMDCPFFIQNVPALSSGRGEILQPVSLSLSGFYLILVKPSVYISTAEAYTGCIPRKRNKSISMLLNYPVYEWKEIVENDFENNVFELHPEIKEIKTRLYQAGAVFASMSGSGSTVYGIFEQHPPELNFEGSEVFITLFGSDTK